MKIKNISKVKNRKKLEIFQNRKMKIFFEILNFENRKNLMGIFLKVDLGSSDSDYQKKLYGTRREAGENKRVVVRFMF